jgi:hypothetical protein
MDVTTITYKMDVTGRLADRHLADADSFLDDVRAIAHNL